jgi:tetratricopeptide (TPR) repeat protein
VLLILLAAIGGGPVTGASHDLAAYLALAARYGSGQRLEALSDLRAWKLSEAETAVAAIRRREDHLRAVATAQEEIAFHAVEAAVLLQAEAGLLALEADSGVAAELHLRLSTGLFEWSRVAADRLRRRASRPGGPPGALRIRERIAPHDYYAALAATSLALGFPAVAQPFARGAVRAAPLDAGVHLVSGCVSASLAELFALRHQESAAERSRADAERAFRDALAVEPGLLEARLRLGKLLVDERRAIEAEAPLAMVEEGRSDHRQRYLARLFLGRVAEQRSRREQAVDWYRRAIETWPDSQAARLALAQDLETSSGPSVSSEPVAATLAASRRPDRAPDPWWGYRLGPFGLWRTLLDRVRGQVIGR